MHFCIDLVRKKVCFVYKILKLPDRSLLIACVLLTLATSVARFITTSPPLLHFPSANGISVQFNLPISQRRYSFTSKKSVVYRRFVFFQQISDWDLQHVNRPGCPVLENTENEVLDQLLARSQWSQLRFGLRGIWIQKRALLFIKMSMDLNDTTDMLEGRTIFREITTTVNNSPSTSFLEKFKVSNDRIRNF